MARIMIDEIDDYKFLKTPKELFRGEKYKKKLKPIDIVVYSLLRDTLQLSHKNSWVNEKNEVYVKLKRETIAEMVGVSRCTVISTIQRLVKMELVEEKRIGLNKANEIYVLHIAENCEVESTETEKEVPEIVKKDEECEELPVEIVEPESVDIALKSNIQTSGYLNIEHQEVVILDPNYTNSNETNFDLKNNNTQSRKTKKEKDEKNVVAEKLMELFRKKTGAELHKHNVLDLLKDKTEEEIMHYLDNIDAFGERRNIGGTFYLAVKNKWAFPKSYKPVPLHKDFEQRKYDQDYFNSLYKEL